MRGFEAGQLLHDIGRSLGKAHTVIHLEEVLHRPLETTPVIATWKIR